MQSLCRSARFRHHGPEDRQVRCVEADSIVFGTVEAVRV